MLSAYRDVCVIVDGDIEVPSYLTLLHLAENEARLYAIVDSLERTCSGCKPVTLITCITQCGIWKLKNQLRRIHDKMQKSDYLKCLLNTLKNEIRLPVSCAEI